MPFSKEARARLDPDAAEIIGRYPHSRSALMPLLYLVQADEGYLSDDGIAYCADKLGLTETEVVAVASFYTMYKRHPVGEYHVGVCTNTLCATMGGDQILADLHEHLGVGDDEPTPDGKVSLEHVECNAACDYAPVVMVNWEFFDNMTPASPGHWSMACGPARTLTASRTSHQAAVRRAWSPGSRRRGSWPGSRMTRRPAGIPPGARRWPGCG